MSLPLRCPNCGDEITVNLVYTAQFSEHRDLDGFECDDYACGAEWDKRGNVTVPSKKSSTSSGPSSSTGTKGDS